MFLRPVNTKVFAYKVWVDSLRGFATNSRFSRVSNLPDRRNQSHKMLGHKDTSRNVMHTFGEVGYKQLRIDRNEYRILRNYIYCNIIHNLFVE